MFSVCQLIVLVISLKRDNEARVQLIVNFIWLRLHLTLECLFGISVNGDVYKTFCACDADVDFMICLKPDSTDFALLPIWRLDNLSSSQTCHRSFQIYDDLRMGKRNIVRRLSKNGKVSKVTSSTMLWGVGKVVLGVISSVSVSM